MSPFDPKTKGTPDIPLDMIPGGIEGMKPDELSRLRRDVLRKSVDEHREGSELVKELKNIAPVAAALIIGILMESAKQEESTTVDEKPDEKELGAVTASSVARKTDVAVEPDKKKEPVTQETVTKSAEVQNTSDIVVIGDSIPKGMISRFEKGKKPDFIGEVGRSTPAILSNVKDTREKLKGKKTAIISCGVNDLTWNDNYEQIAGNIEKIAKECDDAGIEEIIILTHFPYQSDFDRTRFKGKATELREVMLRRFTGKSHIKLIDIYKHFVDEEGDLKKQYASKGKDKLHPYKAYKDALRIIGKESGMDLERLIS
jgi:hypothetical protein